MGLVFGFYLFLAVEGHESFKNCPMDQVNLKFDRDGRTAEDVRDPAASVTSSPAVFDFKWTSGTRSPRRTKTFGGKRMRVRELAAVRRQFSCCWKMSPGPFVLGRPLRSLAHPTTDLLHQQIWATFCLAKRTSQRLCGLKVYLSRRGQTLWGRERWLKKEEKRKKVLWRLRTIELVDRNGRILSELTFTDSKFWMIVKNMCIYQKARQS